MFRQVTYARTSFNAHKAPARDSSEVGSGPRRLIRRRANGRVRQLLQLAHRAPMEARIPAMTSDAGSDRRGGRLIACGVIRSFLHGLLPRRNPTRSSPAATGGIATVPASRMARTTDGGPRR